MRRNREQDEDEQDPQPSTSTEEPPPLNTNGEPQQPALGDEQLSLPAPDAESQRHVRGRPKLLPNTIVPGLQQRIKSLRQIMKKRVKKRRYRKSS